MHTYLLEPTGPLVFRSGKPFGTGSRDGANFPWPSSIAGALRTALMDADGMKGEDTLQVAVGGPFLLRSTARGSCLYVPKPADALALLDEHDQAGLHRLRPGRLPQGVGADLPQGLAPVVLAQDAPHSKPQKLARFWPLDAVLAWDRGETVDLEELKREPAPLANTDTRTQVVIDRSSLAARDGGLFQVQGLDFGAVRRTADGMGGYSKETWRLAARFAGALDARLLHLGGERRTAWLERANAAPLGLPKAHAEMLRDAPRLALTLLTPAPLSAGWKPAWLDDGLVGEFPAVAGLRLKLVACALERWQGVSGWDLAKGQPKAARKAAPAGSTYWFDIVGRPAGDWPAALWLASLCDEAQTRRDGWGLVLPRAGFAIDFAL